MDSNKITEAIILVGGLGTRLRTVIGEFPKPMAPINGKPFLSIILKHLSNQGINHVVLAVSYKKEIIENTYGDSFEGMRVSYSIEKEPLGTGGAIVQALTFCETDQVLILNGDTHFPIAFHSLYKFHLFSNSDLTLALKEVVDQDRFGAVICNSKGKVLEFQEKSHIQKGLINGGIYILNKNAIAQLDFSEKFSFETDFMQKHKLENIYGVSFSEDFIDIGIPSDYEYAQKVLVW